MSTILNSPDSSSERSSNVTSGALQAAVQSHLTLERAAADFLHEIEERQSTRSLVELSPARKTFARKEEPSAISRLLRLT